MSQKADREAGPSGKREGYVRGHRALQPLGTWGAVPSVQFRVPGRSRNWIRIFRQKLCAILRSLDFIMMATEELYPRV